MIELEAASVSAPTADGTTTILHPTSLRLDEPRISIIGGNGSGKSTLARLLNGLIVPSTGTVRVRVDREGTGGSTPVHDSREDPPAWLDTAHQGAAVRRHVGFVFTDPAAQLVMPTALEDVALSLRRRHKKKPERLAAARAALERFDLGELADRSVHTLSGGQKQLLALTAVLATDPAILVADEPTTLLDLRNGLRVRELLTALPQQVIVVTHDLELAASTDRTIVVDGGAVAFDGRPEAAIAHYRELAGRHGARGPGPSGSDSQGYGSQGSGA